MTGSVCVEGVGCAIGPDELGICSMLTLTLLATYGKSTVIATWAGAGVGIIARSSFEDGEQS
jgi:hypothetical protein